MFASVGCLPCTLIAPAEVPSARTGSPHAKSGAWPKLRVKGAASRVIQMNSPAGRVGLEAEVVIGGNPIALADDAMLGGKPIDRADDAMFGRKSIASDAVAVSGGNTAEPDSSRTDQPPRSTAVSPTFQSWTASSASPGAYPSAKTALMTRVVDSRASIARAAIVRASDNSVKVDAAADDAAKVGIAATIAQTMARPMKPTCPTSCLAFDDRCSNTLITPPRSHPPRHARHHTIDPTP